MVVFFGGRFRSILFHKDRVDNIPLHQRSVLVLGCCARLEAIEETGLAKQGHGCNVQDVACAYQLRFRIYAKL